MAHDRVAVVAGVGPGIGVQFVETFAQVATSLQPGRPHVIPALARRYVETHSRC